SSLRFPAHDLVSLCLHPCAGAATRCAHKVASPPPTAAPALGRRILATEHARRRRSRRQDSAPPFTAATRASRRDPHIPIDRPRHKQRPFPPRGFLLGRLSNAGPAPRTTVAKGPASETLRLMRCSVSSEGTSLQSGVPPSGNSRSQRDTGP